VYGLNLEEEASVPMTNLAKSVHFFMWVFVGNGCKVELFLFTLPLWMTSHNCN
jgi:hypothetical protein